MKLTFNFTIAAVLMLPVFLTAQDAGKPNVYRNEVGADVTSLINQIFSINASEDYQEYQPTYYVTYKRLLKKFSLRLGIGGSSKSFDRPIDTPLIFYVATSRSLIDYRLGIEKNADLNKRWSFHYGIDFRHTFYKLHDDYIDTDRGWGVGNDIHGRVLAIAPIMMIEFKINNRLSLQTEANFTAYFKRSEKKYFFFQLPDNPSSQPKPSADVEAIKEHGTMFTVPNFIIIAVKI